jgi:hypothetical protein
LPYGYRLSDSRFCENFKEPGNSEERITLQCYGCINEILRRLKKEGGTGVAKTRRGRKY